METKNKRGISLIVLVITIIVMIILATVIILSLNNSGIIGNTNKAKNDSDTATLKEYVNTLKLDWEFMTAEEKTAAGSFSEYATSKLEEKGYNRMVTEDGIILTEGATAAVKAGIEIGDEVVEYTVIANKYIPDSSKTGTTNSELTAQTNLKWIYVGVSEKGELLITPDVLTGVLASSDVVLYGKAGYLTGPDELNTICDKLYTVTGKGKARSMNIDDVTRILGYIGEKGSYYDSGNNRVPTTEAKTIFAIASEIDYDMEEEGFETSVPELGKKIEDYYSDYYYINKTSDVNEMKNSKYVDLIYPSSGHYWLASSCVTASFGRDYAYFSALYVRSADVRASDLFLSTDRELEFTSSVRPVVSLEPSIQLTKVSEGTWSI